MLEDCLKCLVIAGCQFRFNNEALRMIGEPLGYGVLVNQRPCYVRVAGNETLSLGIPKR